MILVFWRKHILYRHRAMTEKPRVGQCYSPPTVLPEDGDNDDHSCIATNMSKFSVLRNRSFPSSVLPVPQVDKIYCLLCRRIQNDADQYGGGQGSKGRFTPDLSSFESLLDSGLVSWQGQVNAVRFIMFSICSR